jgi:mannuronan 5-epimerase
MRMPRQLRPRLGAYALVLVAVVGLAIVASFVSGRTYREIKAPPAPKGRTACTSAMDPVDAALIGLPSDSCDRNPGGVDASIRAILVSTVQIKLLSGGETVKTIPRSGQTATLDSIAKAVANADWISSVAGRVSTSAAVIASDGLVLDVSAPTTTDLVMAAKPGVFLAANRATLHLRNVTVEASTRETPLAGSRTSSQSDLGRPFVVAYNRSTMTVDSSHFLYLGRDWNASYGLSWSTGSTGAVTHSTFDNDFIGVYSNDAHGLTVTDNQFRNCSLYGVDPHSGSTGLDVERNLAEGSGRHGIIFSDNVKNGIVRDNVTQNNGLNGIMMDEGSTGNLIQGNISRGNGSDGITLASSSGNRVLDNQVINNRVGLHVRGSSSASDQISGNQIHGNDLASQGISNLTGANDATGNSTEWRPRILIAIWAVAAILAIAVCAGTFAARRKRSRRRPAGPLPAVRTMV